MINITDVIIEYKRLVKENIRRNLKAMTILLLFNLAIVVVFFFLYSSDGVFTVLFWVFFSFEVIMILLTLIFRNSAPEKPLYNYLYDQIINDINYDNSNDYNLQYSPYSKDKEFVKEGGLFTRVSSRKLRYKIEYINQQGAKVILYDAYIFTQSNNSTVVHLDGLYAIFNKSNSDYFQLRKNSSPKLKGSKFTKINSRDYVKEYVKSNSKEYIDQKFYTLYDLLRKNSQKDKAYLGGIENQIHIGLWGRKTPKKIKEINQQVYANLKSNILEMISDIDQYYSSIEY